MSENTRVIIGKNEDSFENEELSKPLKSPKSGKGAKRLWIIALIVGVLVLLLILGIVPRMRRYSISAQAAQEKTNAIVQVSTAKARRPPPTNELVLPGNAQAIQETTVSAQTSGYVKRVLVDIGDKVEAGQLLAEIDSPDLDQQLAQAQQVLSSAEQALNQAKQDLNQRLEDVNQARQGLDESHAGLDQAQSALKQAQTNRELAKVTLNRSTQLIKDGVISRQENDETQASFDVKDADVSAAQSVIKSRQATINSQKSVIESKLSTVQSQRATIEGKQADVNAQQANVKRLTDLQAFKRVTAPFSGVVTARNVEIGSLITTSGGSTGGNGGASTGGLFHIAKNDPIRVFINVPQTFAGAINNGLQAEVSIKELPGTTFDGHVIRTANAISQTSRTLPTEVLIPNEAGKLLPGMYAEVKLSLPQANNGVVIIPSSALFVKADGVSVFIVKPDNTVHQVPVVAGRDFGKEIEIIDGLQENQSVVTNPTDGLTENEQVEAKDITVPNKQ